MNKITNLNYGTLKGSDKCMLISLIIIGLQSEKFRNNSELLEEALCECIDERIILEVIRVVHSYNGDIGFLTNEVKDFLQRHSDEKDLIGKLYIEFLKDAGKIDDKNVILTPNHIRHLMCRLADVKSDEVVIDNCSGTCGFGIECLEMGNCNYYGIEIDPKLYIIGYANLLLLETDRWNVICGDGLSELKECDKCVINPPYDKNLSFEFLLSLMRNVNDGGKIVIIAPSNLLKKNKKRLQEITDYLTLEVVMQMPENLFSEQGRTVRTSIFVFAKNPQDYRKTTTVYDLDDDGFVTIQRKGRVDVTNSWDKREDIIISELTKKCNQIRMFDDYGNFYQNGIRDVEDGYYKIGDLFDMCKGSLSSEKSIDGDYTFITASEEFKTHNSYTHDCEALIIAVGASGSLGRTHYYNGKFVASNLCLIMTVKDSMKDMVNLEYLCYYFNSIKNKIRKEIGDGSAKITISKDDLCEYYIKIPCIEEQNAIYEKYIKQLNIMKSNVKMLETELDNIIRTSV